MFSQYVFVTINFMQMLGENIILIHIIFQDMHYQEGFCKSVHVSVLSNCIFMHILLKNQKIYSFQEIINKSKGTCMYS